jgi:homoserine dehydrogenase
VTALRIGIAGLGTVGAAVVQQLQDHRALIANQAGRAIEIIAVAARDRTKTRSVTTSAFTWFDDPRQLAAMPDIDVVIELIGGMDGVAKELAEATLRQQKYLVTANKALIARHGMALAHLAEANGTQINFEAAVAGGIPIIKTLREAVAGQPVRAVYGILNGTCNYILTQMQDFGLEFTTALQAAQRAGYAEADPAMDIDGHDTAHKLTILSALAFQHAPDLASIPVSGISNLSSADLKFAAELKCCIKLLGVARMTPQGLQHAVAPCLVPLTSPLAAIHDVLNAVQVETAAGTIMLSGRGAGGAATAGAVIADLIDLARGHRIPPLLRNPDPIPLSQPDQITSRWYLRLQVADQPGVVADIGAILRDAAISIESLLQHGRSAVSSVPVVIVTHEASEAAMHAAVQKIAALPFVQQTPCCLRLITGDKGC